MSKVAHKTDETREPKPSRHHGPTLRQAKVDAIKAAHDLRYPQSVIDEIREAKNEAEIYRIMHKQREKL